MSGVITRPPGASKPRIRFKRSHPFGLRALFLWFSKKLAVKQKPLHMSQIGSDSFGAGEGDRRSVEWRNDPLDAQVK